MQNYDTILTDTIELFFLSHCVTLFFHFDGMHIYLNTVSSRDPFSTVLHGKASVFRGPFFYGEVKRTKVSSMDPFSMGSKAHQSVFQGPFFYGMARVYCMACVSCMTRIARQTSFFLFPILIIPVLDMESPQRDPRPPTLPTTIQEGPDSMHAETDYNLPILRMGTLLISPELRFLRHPTISGHHTYLLVLTSRMDAPSGRPYLAVFGIALCLITRHTEGPYCTT